MRKIITVFIFVLCCNGLKAQPNGEKGNYFIYGGIAVVALVVAGLLLWRYNKTRGKKPDIVLIIKSVFPNPSHGTLTIRIEGMATTLEILNMNGQVLGKFAIAGNEIHLDLSSASRGNYIAVAHYGANQSNAVQFSLQ